MPALIYKPFEPTGKNYQILNRDMSPCDEYNSKELAIYFCWLTLGQKVLDVKEEKIIYG